MSDSVVDEIDQAILHHLQEDGRRPVNRIADELNVSDNTVRNRIEAMKEAGTISGYRVDVDYEAAGVQHHYMFICTARVSKREELAREVRNFPCVTEVITLMTGNYNVYIIAAGEGKDDISELASSVDETGLIVEREHLVRNHVRQPYSGFRPPAHLTRK